MYCLKFNARVVQRILYGNLVDFPLGIMSLGWAKLLNLNKTDSPIGLPVMLDWKGVIFVLR
jgi:hypothetical protein